MSYLTRRSFLKSSAALGAGLGLGLGADTSYGFPQYSEPVPGERPAQDKSIALLNPRGRVPLSFIIDDSTCLVNLAHYGIPEFRRTFPDRYQQEWEKLPKEIPDAFVRKFGEWCRQVGVKGKYSIVPYPACVGRVDQELPGWTKRQLSDSLDLVRDFMMPNWDIHPEMITHTRAVDTKTGKPINRYAENNMENWRFTDGKSVDEMTDYLSFALQILKNVDLPCEGITTPGGFGNRVLAELSQATLRSCRDVFGAEIPHYFRHLFTDERSVAPRVEYAKGLKSGQPECVVSIIGCTGDWTGGWDGLSEANADLFITPDRKSGRLVDVIKREEPAVLVCHWPGIYYNGEETGLKTFQEVVRRVHREFLMVRWMKLSEIARYWAARELTEIKRDGRFVLLEAPYATSDFTLRYRTDSDQGPGGLTFPGSKLSPRGLKKVANPFALDKDTWCQEGDEVTVCFELPKGKTTLFTR